MKNFDSLPKVTYLGDHATSNTESNYHFEKRNLNMHKPFGNLQWYHPSKLRKWLPPFCSSPNPLTSSKSLVRSRTEVFHETVVLKKFQISRKALVLESLFNKLASLAPTTLLKEKLQQKLQTSFLVDCLFYWKLTTFA